MNAHGSLPALNLPPEPLGGRIVPVCFNPKILIDRHPYRLSQPHRQPANVSTCQRSNVISHFIRLYLPHCIRLIRLENTLLSYNINMKNMNAMIRSSKKSRTNDMIPSLFDYVSPPACARFFRVSRLPRVFFTGRSLREYACPRLPPFFRGSGYFGGSGNDYLTIRPFTMIHSPLTMIPLFTIHYLPFTLFRPTISNVSQFFPHLLSL